MMLSTFFLYLLAFCIQYVYDIGTPRKCFSVYLFETSASMWSLFLCEIFPINQYPLLLTTASSLFYVGTVIPKKEHLAHPIHVPTIIKWHFKWQPVLLLTVLAVLFYHHCFNVVPINPLYKLYDLTQTL